MVEVNAQVIDAQIAKLTSPEAGFVQSTQVNNLFSVIAPHTINTPNLTPDIVAITGPSGAGKDSLIDEIHSITSSLVRVPTGTSRDRRATEPQDAYTWMRKRQNDEDINVYIERMVAQHDLIEYDFHNGNLYGLPMHNLKSAMQYGTPLINIDTRGIRTLREKLASTTIVSILVCPENTDMLMSAMGEDRDNIVDRIEMAAEYMSDAQNIVDYVYLNKKSKVYKTILRIAALGIIECLGVGGT